MAKKFCSVCDVYIGDGVSSTRCFPHQDTSVKSAVAIAEIATIAAPMKSKRGYAARQPKRPTAPVLIVPAPVRVIPTSPSPVLTTALMEQSKIKTAIARFALTKELTMESLAMLVRETFIDYLEIDPVAPVCAFLPLAAMGVIWTEDELWEEVFGFALSIVLWSESETFQWVGDDMWQLREGAK